MSAIPNTPKKETGKLNTTIKPEVLAEFKYNCKKNGLNMNTIIEAFMRQFNEGGFYLKFGRENQVEVELDKKEYSDKVVKAIDTDDNEEDVVENFGEYSK